MNLTQELNNLRLLRPSGPNPAWVESTRTELLQFCKSHEQFSAVPVRPPFLWRFAVVSVPIASFIIITALLVPRLSNVPQPPQGGVAVSDSPLVRVALDSNLPLAQSIDFSTPKPVEVAVVSNQNRTVQRAQRSQRHKVRRWRPLARTRLALSIQSLPDARWVFSENFPAENARWVFSSNEQRLNSFGT
jgi:hypothetical protein